MELSKQSNLRALTLPLPQREAPKLPRNLTGPVLWRWVLEPVNSYAMALWTERRAGKVWPLRDRNGPLYRWRDAGQRLDRQGPQARQLSHQPGVDRRSETRPET